MSIGRAHIVLYSCQAHMVYSEHDANFYALDKQVRMCVHFCVFMLSVSVLLKLITMLQLNGASLI